jgi:hypothetical protein
MAYSKICGAEWHSAEPYFGGMESRPTKTITYLCTTTQDNSGFELFQSLKICR